jgi:coniferyl-aldehyde dehydrogenase
MNERSSPIGAVLAAQRAAQLREGPPDRALRVDRLRRLRALLTARQHDLCAAADADFGCRPATLTRMEILGSLGSIDHAISEVRRWMRPRRAPVPMLMRLTGASAEVQFQPLGVVGLVAPWNFPVNLVATPLAGIFAAGNRAMIKPSELTPRVSAILAEACHKAFAAEELAVIEGDVAAARAFTALPFDHLLFTGSPAVGRHVMRAAADNLVPVTLELGGKCPVIIGRSADLNTAAIRVLRFNMQNAGQVCMAPDTVFVPEGSEDGFIEHARAAAAVWTPTLLDNPDYTSMINRAAYDRVAGYVAEARAAGVRVETINPANEDFARPDNLKLPPSFVIDAPDELAISQNEIFGPAIALRRYASLDAVIDYVNARPRPLALYYFGNSQSEIDHLSARIVCGGITVNDIGMHAGIESLPMGGVGNSGTGSYHGRWGFERFSHAKAVFRQGRFSLAGLFSPPYKARHAKMLDRAMRS